MTCASFGFIETRQYWEIDYRDKVRVEDRLYKVRNYSRFLAASGNSF